MFSNIAHYYHAISHSPGTLFFTVAVKTATVCYTGHWWEHFISSISIELVFFFIFAMLLSLSSWWVQQFSHFLSSFVVFFISVHCVQVFVMLATAIHINLCIGTRFSFHFSSYTFCDLSKHSKAPWFFGFLQ